MKAIAEQSPDAASTARGSWQSLRSDGLVVVAQLALIAVLLGLWELCARAGWIDRNFTSQPSEIAQTFLTLIQTPALWRNIVATVAATLIGFIGGSLIGIGAGILLGSSEFIDRVSSPIVAIGNGIPRIALAPLFVLWFGLSIWSKVALAVSLVVFILLYNTKSALRTVSQDHIVMSQMLDMGRWERFRKILLPTCMPAIMAGLRIGVVLGLLGVIASEMIASSDGLGQMIVESSATFQIGRLMALILLVSALAAIMNALVDLLERRTIWWRM